MVYIPYPTMCKVLVKYIDCKNNLISGVFVLKCSVTNPYR